MKNIKRLIYLLILIVTTTISCENPENKGTSKEDVKKELSESMETIKAYTLEERDTLLRQFEARRDTTRTQIDSLKNKLIFVQKIKTKVLKRKVNDLEYRQEKVEHKIAELRSSSEAAYHALKISIDSAMIELVYSIAEANKEFEK